MKNLEIAKKLIELDGEEWKKGDHHRVYIAPYVAANFFDSDHARFGKQHKVYFDVKAGKFACSHRSVSENLNCLLEEI